MTRRRGRTSRDKSEETDKGRDGSGSGSGRRETKEERAKGKDGNQKARAKGKAMKTIKKAEDPMKTTNHGTGEAVKATHGEAVKATHKIHGQSPGPNQGERRHPSTWEGHCHLHGMGEDQAGEHPLDPP